jgi:hypothetical protein
MIDIHGGSKDPRAARLSNFTDRQFVFDGVHCVGIEGILQALKEQDFDIQKKICMLPGKKAKEAGMERDSWKQRQMLWWHGVCYHRSSRAYQTLITKIYDTAYEQDDTFAVDLLALGSADICHSIGNTDQKDTVLTEVEMIHQLNRLRIRAQRS